MCQKCHIQKQVNAMITRLCEPRYPIIQPPPATLTLVTQPRPNEHHRPLISMSEACKRLGRTRTVVKRLIDTEAIYAERVTGSDAWVFDAGYIDRIAPILGPRQRPGVHIDPE